MRPRKWRLSRTMLGKGEFEAAAAAPAANPPSASDPRVFGNYPTRAERTADRWVHITGIGFGLIGGATLVGAAYWDDGVGRVISVSI